jgi:hypothetical protein
MVFVTIANSQERIRYVGKPAGKSIKKSFPIEFDFRVSHGFLPITYDFPENFLGERYYCDVAPPTIENEYYGAQRYEGNLYSTGSLNLSHSVRVKKWLEVGAVISYNGSFRNIYSTVDHSVVTSDNRHSFFFTPTIRFAWFTREYIRMYSSVGVGVGVMIYDDPQFRNVTFHEKEIQFGPSIQLTGFGISVGKSVYGFAEAGAVGTLGLFTIGMGYRFKPVTKSF